MTETPFRPRDVEERTQGMIPRLANELVDGFVEFGETDLFRTYADPMRVRSLLLHARARTRCRGRTSCDWNEGLMPGLANFEGDAVETGTGRRRQRGARRRDRTGAGSTRRPSPTAAVLSWMLHHEEEGRRMTRAQIVANTKLMLSGGLQEPRDLIALTLCALLREPAQFAHVRDDRTLVKAAVEETLRWAGPVGTSTRQATQAAELAGVTLAPGSLDRRGAVVGEPGPPSVEPTPIASTSTARRGPTWRSRRAPTSAWGPGSGAISRGCRSMSCWTACPGSLWMTSAPSRCRGGSSELRIRCGYGGARERGTNAPDTGPGRNGREPPSPSRPQGGHAVLLQARPFRDPG